MIQLLIALVLFAALALFSPRLLADFTRRHHLKHPHRHLILVFRLWFAALALATLWLLLRQSHLTR